MNVEVRTKKYNIIKSGIAFIPTEENQLELHIHASETFNFIVILKFVVKKDAEQDINVEIKDNVITYICTNFRETGTGIKEVELVTISNKKIFLSFWHYKMSDGSPRKIEYSIYQER